MKKAFLSMFFFGVLVFLGTAAQANLISYGNFSGATIDSLSGGFSPATGSPLKQWLDNFKWEVVTDTEGVGGLNTYAKHTVNSGIRLFQAIDANSLGTYTLEFDYRYASGYGYNIVSANVLLLGVNSSDPLLSQYPFDGDGFDPSNLAWGALYKSALSYQPDWFRFSTTVNVAQNYDYWVLVFTAGGDDNLFRGVDNVNLAAVPEPATMLLLGAGLLGLAAVRRRLNK